MGKFVPKSISEDKWKKLIPQRTFAVRCNPKEEVLIRLGTGIGLYFTFSQTKSGSLNLNAIDYESGEINPQDPYPKNRTLSIGRIEECDIKAKHAIVSRKHAEIRLEENILLVKDLGSTNGTSILKENISFDIKDYLDEHPLDQQKESKMDWVHEEFGPTIDDFLKKYSKENLE